MKKLFLLFSLIIATSLLYGQNDKLVLKKQNRSKQKIIESNKTIKVITNSGYKVRGEFQVVDDKSIAIGFDTIQLADIKNIRYKSIGGIITGSVVGVTGFTQVIGGVGIIIVTSSEGFFVAIIGLTLGIPVIAVGTLITTAGVLVATVGKAHKAKKWEYHVAKCNGS